MPLFQKTRRRQVLDLPIASIRPNPNQPRQTFDRAELLELSQSIAQLGVLQPLTVRQTPDGWELVAGERRLRAARLAGLSSVPCLPVAADEDASTLLALVENVQRRDLDVWEEASALRTLIDRCHLSQEEAARRVGKSQSAVANKLRLLRLPPDVIDALRSAHLTERHARALLRLDGPERQREALAYLLEHRLNVAKTEAYVDKLCRARPAPRRGPAPIYRTKDVRLFLNTLKRGLTIMRSAGVDAQCGREETDREITLTIHISK